MAQRVAPTNPPLTPPLFMDIDFYRKLGLYFHLEPIEQTLPNGRVIVTGHGTMIMLGGYSYLGLIGHPKIDAAAKAAVDRYGTGTHGVRLLAGTLPLHDELEARIARFKQAENAVTFSSGYVANVSTISSLLRRGDVVLSDKRNHASIVDGCRLAQGRFLRFRHDDLEHLEYRLHQVAPGTRVLVVVDAVFSMDGDVVDLPEVSRLCREHGAYLMVDEAHSLGVLGETGHGIEEHFGMEPETIDIKMGTLSKAIPSAGGYIAGSRELVEFVRHEARGFVFSAALPPPSAGAALAALDVIEAEPERVQALRRNARHLAARLRDAGFALPATPTAIMPIVCGSTDRAARLAHYCRERGVFVQAIVSPVVPKGTERLRVCVSAAHTVPDLDHCAEAIIAGARRVGGVLEAQLGLSSASGAGHPPGA